MSVNYYFSLVLGVSVEKSDFFDSGPPTARCTYGHPRPQTDRFCPEDGTPVQIRPASISPKEKLRLFLGDADSDIAHIWWGEEPRNYYPVTDSVGIFAADAIGSNMSDRPDDKRLLGVRLYAGNSEDRIPKGFPVTDAALAKARDKLLQAMNALEIEGEIALYPRIYVSV